MTKKFLSAITALSMAVCTFTGCSDLDKDGNLKEASSYETVETDEVRFKVRSDFKDISDDMWQGYSYDGDKQFSIYEYYDSEGRMSAEAIIDYCNYALKDYDNCYSEIIDCGDYDIVVFSCDIEEGMNTRYFLNKKDYDLSGLTIDVNYPDAEDEPLMRQLALEIFESAEYIGEKLPKQTDFECDYFSISIPDEYIFNKTNDNNVVIKYEYMDSLMKKNSTLRVQVLTDSEYTSAEEYLDSVCEEWIDKDIEGAKYEIVEEVHPVEILGYDGYCASYAANSPVLHNRYVYQRYAFEKDGAIYTIYSSIPEDDGHEQVEADFEKLIDCIKIK